jgi:hypothetical protein
MIKKASHDDATPPVTEAQTREARLKAALKSNMGRRKAQARARNAPGDKAKNEQEQ